MKNGKRPTRRQKQMLKELGLNYDNWLIIRDDKFELKIEHKLSGNTRVLKRTEQNGFY